MNKDTSDHVAHTTEYPDGCLRFITGDCRICALEASYRPGHYRKFRKRRAKKANAGGGR